MYVYDYVHVGIRAGVKVRLHGRLGYAMITVSLFLFLRPADTQQWRTYTTSPAQKLMKIAATKSSGIAGKHSHLATVQ